MKYNKPELIERLSAEYVLGTLQGKARDRFERLMAESYRIRMAVWSWESQIVPMASVAPTVRPPKHIWPSIRARISKTRPRLQAVAKPKITPAPVQNLVSGFWRWWSYAATSACLVLGVLLALQLPSTSIQSASENSIDSVALFSNQEAQPQWLVSFDMESGQLKAKALNAIAVETGQAFELWVLPDAGNPQSLGLLPVSDSAEATVNTALSQALIALLRSANGLAISVEPEGGSPTGLPTGPVVYQSSIIEL